MKEAERETAGDSLLVIANTPELTGLQHSILREELLRLPQVRSATAMQILAWTENNARMMLASSSSTSSVEHSGNVYVVGLDFFETFGIDLIAGRWFDPERLDDIAATAPGPDRLQNLVISRSLAEKLGYASASAIIDRMVFMPRFSSSDATALPFRVIGVVEDATLAIASRYGSISNVYLFNPELEYHVVRLSGQDISGALDAIDARWETLVPNVAINRRFVVEYFNDSYASFARLIQGFTGLAVVAWIISTIGLYALAVLITGRRVREIAIRRTLGAGRGQIVLMLLGNFSVPVLVANLLAWPFAYIAGVAYLNVFMDPVPLTPTPFAIALATSLVITCIAVGGQAWRAANTAPQQVMRSE